MTLEDAQKALIEEQNEGTSAMKERDRALEQIAEVIEILETIPYPLISLYPFMKKKGYKKYRRIVFFTDKKLERLRKALKTYP